MNFGGGRCVSLQEMREPTSLYRRAVTPTLVSLAGVVLSVATVGAQAASDNEIDRFMEQVLARRLTNSLTLRQYVLDEDERVEIVGPDLVPLWRGRREFTWYERDGILVRSPVRFDGVAIDDARQRADRDRAAVGRRRRR